MATVIQGKTGAVAPEARGEAEALEPSQDAGAGESPLLFVNLQPEPLVECPAAAVAVPAARPSDAGLRAFDVTLALVCLVLLWPVMLAAVLFVRASSPGPIIFRHVRVGQNGARFECLKFRTMDSQADSLLGELLETCGTLRHEWQDSQKIRRDPRVTWVGKILRRFSIDELPQLFNVLRGEMSMVGPRPIVEAEIDRYGPHFADYCSVKPGLTGLWQISGRNCLPYERRVELDSHYARARSLELDLAIIVRTVPVVLRGTGC